MQSVQNLQDAAKNRIEKMQVMIIKFADDIKTMTEYNDKMKKIYKDDKEEFDAFMVGHSVGTRIYPPSLKSGPSGSGPTSMAVGPSTHDSSGLDAEATSSFVFKTDRPAGITTGGADSYAVASGPSAKRGSSSRDVGDLKRTKTNEVGDEKSHACRSMRLVSSGCEWCHVRGRPCLRRIPRRRRSRIWIR